MLIRKDSLRRAHSLRSFLCRITNVGISQLAVEYLQGESPSRAQRRPAALNKALTRLRRKGPAKQAEKQEDGEGS